jgi:hypothetical protein
MTPYYCNDAVLELHNVHSLVDLTRQCLEIVTGEGAELQLVIERVVMTPNVTLAAAVEARLAERRRSTRGFEILSVANRDYSEVSGSEVRMTFIDKDRGPLFFHELHFEIERTRVGYIGSCRLAQAAACDQWMQATLQTLRLR